MDQARIRADFPIFSNDPTLVYLDSAATALKPESVLKAMDEYYRTYSSNIARGLYPLAEKATLAVEATREKVAQFIESDKKTVVFVPSATAGINLVANALRCQIKKEHNIVVTAADHHSNFLPWKELASAAGAELRILPVNADGFLDAKELVKLVDHNTFLVAFPAVSNVLGLINPVSEMVKTIKEKNSTTLALVDACQAVGHIPVSMKHWGADYLVFSGHKLLGPTGIGALVGTEKSLSLLGPVNVGGGTVLDAVCSPVLYKELPDRLEGGTPNIAGIIGLGAAIDYLQNIGITEIALHDQELCKYAIERLIKTFGQDVAILGSGDFTRRAGLISFTLSPLHPHDIAQILGENNVCVRAGEHCARPLHHSLNVPASARMSFHVYTTFDDIDACIEALQKAKQFFL